MELRELVTEARVAELSRLGAVESGEVAAFVDRLNAELPGMLRQVICTFGYEHIDEEEEREELTRLIMAGLAMVVPPQYALVWNLIRPAVRKLVRLTLDEAAEQGASYCEGVTSILLPFPIGA